MNELAVIDAIGKALRGVFAELDERSREKAMRHIFVFLQLEDSSPLDQLTNEHDVMNAVRRVARTWYGEREWAETHRKQKAVARVELDDFPPF
jgi:hypothetical protein